MAEHNTLGNEGERKAKAYLQERAYTVLHANWRYKHKEIDLVAKKGKFLVIVEVKTRTYGGMQQASESITNSKMRYLVEAADAYVETYNREEEVRFDVLALTFFEGNWKIEHMEDAFNAMEVY